MDLSSSEDYGDGIELVLDFNPREWVPAKLDKAKPVSLSELPPYRPGFKPTGDVATPDMLLLLGEIRRRQKRNLQKPRKVANNKSGIIIFREFLAVSIRQVVSEKYANCEFDIVCPNGEAIIVYRGKLIKDAK